MLGDAGALLQAMGQCSTTNAATDGHDVSTEEFETGAPFPRSASRMRTGNSMRDGLRKLRSIPSREDPSTKILGSTTTWT
jgi:hypothetical protein